MHEGHEATLERLIESWFHYRLSHMYEWSGNFTRSRREIAREWREYRAALGLSPKKPKEAIR